MSSSSVSERIAKACTPYEHDRYVDIDLNRLATFAIYLLTESRIVPTLENLVVALFRLFPEKFSLPGFSEYPDATRGNRALLQLRPKYRNWAVKSSAEGYVLTELGHRVAKQTRDLLNSPVRERTNRRSVPSPPRTLYEGIARNIRRSTAFRKFTAGEGGAVARPEIFELLGAVPYTPVRILRSKLYDWAQLAQQAEDTKMLDFLEWMNRKFPEVFSNRGGRG
ncbi:MAG: hypothetical protein ACE5IJ_07220 [Thermoplasmata archaeon]